MRQPLHHKGGRGLTLVCHFAVGFCGRYSLLWLKIVEPGGIRGRLPPLVLGKFTAYSSDNVFSVLCLYPTNDCRLFITVNNQHNVLVETQLDVVPEPNADSVW